MTERSKEGLDPFVRHRVFPEAEYVFAFAPVSLEDALNDGLVVIDTNALLVPYTAGQASIKQIKRTYTQLAKDGRLKVPGQVAREFAIHRAEKFKTLYQQLSRKRAANIAPSEYPLLEGLKEYSELLTIEKQLADKLKEYRVGLAAVLQHVRDWKWDDPVSRLYRELFSGNVVVDPPLDRDATLKESGYRQAHKLPPGFKDAANDFSGIGDLVIWQTILHLGSETKRHLVFVSGDEKTDWLYQSENEALYPRYELLEEYRRASDGKTFHIIPLAALLERTGASKAVVEQVRLEEASQVVSQKHDDERRHEFAFRAEHAVLLWLLATHPQCEVRAGSEHDVDFVVTSERGALAFEVKSLLRPSLVRPTLTSSLARLASKKDRFGEVNLVLVCEDARVLRSVDRTLATLPSPGVRSVAGGLLTKDGSFDERFKYTYHQTSRLKIGY